MISSTGRWPRRATALSHWHTRHVPLPCFSHVFSTRSVAIIGRSIPFFLAASIVSSLTVLLLYAVPPEAQRTASFFDVFWSNTLSLRRKQKIQDKERKVLTINRAEAEKCLTFAGLVAFNCLNRADSSAVLGELKYVAVQCS